MGSFERCLDGIAPYPKMSSVGQFWIRSGSAKEEHKQSGVIYMQRILIIILILFTACESAESPTLKECRTIQENVLARAASLDSSLNSQLNTLRESAVTMSTDTLLATDSLRRMQYSELKEYASKLEYKLSEFHVWREHLILLPSMQEINDGIRNPFGAHTGDAGILHVLKSYSDTLTIIEGSISELISHATHE
jgi:hypothetical protein